jgi:serine/threonine-protein kinase
MPDIQRVRPGVSAALAAVIERATCKERRNRYASVEDMALDLEQALAIEAARRGEATGEATTVLRGLPDETGEIAPGRLRRPGRYAAAAVLLAGAVAALILLLATDAERGKRGTARATPPARLRSVHLVAASDYDPWGPDKQEHSADGVKAIDGDGTTSWSTETYRTQTLAPKPGVGLYVDAGSGRRGRRLDIRTGTPGFLAKLYGSNVIQPRGAGADTFADWGRPLASVTVTSAKKVYLPAAGQPYRYYLIWIFRLPPGRDHAEITTVRLYQ